MDRVGVEPTTSASLFQGSSTPYLNSSYGNTTTVQSHPVLFACSAAYDHCQEGLEEASWNDF
jgi:hypothetical protein